VARSLPLSSLANQLPDGLAGDGKHNPGLHQVWGEGEDERGIPIRYFELAQLMRLSSEDLRNFQILVAYRASNFASLSAQVRRRLNKG
jgi:hypothetical protein